MSVSRPSPTPRIPVSPYSRPRPMVEGTLLLDGNEGSRPDDELLRRLAERPAAALRNYPDTGALERALARRHGVDTHQIVVTAGADDAIDRVFRAYTGEGSEVVVPVPTFEMVHRFAQISGARLRTTPWGRSFPIDAIESLVGPDTRLVIVISPNNPTGATVSATELTRVIEAAEDALVLFDHVYAEYADRDLTALALEYPNVVVSRTFSKAWGLAGCRVGYAISDPEVAQALRSAANPYPVSSLSAQVALDRLAHSSAAVDRHVRRVRAERSALASLLRGHGVSSIPSQANFVLADFAARRDFVERSLAALGILVRGFPGRPEISNALRISLPGDAEDFARLQRGLATVLAPEALLFDLDGVLADTGQSYRRCTLETIASFGVSLTREQLQDAALGGDANNDWELCRRLLAERGKSVSLAEVKERFQQLYLGDGETPGYREREWPLVDGALLRRLARRLPLAVVTGRPREEARWFLDRHGLGQLFSALIAQEDAPGKPDPAPVRLALETLGVERAWMLGDTPDDIVAARDADVLPLGIPEPDYDDMETRTRLLAAGAAVVLGDAAELESLL